MIKKIFYKNLENLVFKIQFQIFILFLKIKNLILNKKLNVYGLWFEIKSGNLMLFDDKKYIC